MRWIYSIFEFKAQRNFHAVYGKYGLGWSYENCLNGLNGIASQFHTSNEILSWSRLRHDRSNLIFSQLRTDVTIQNLIKNKFLNFENIFNISGYFDILSLYPHYATYIFFFIKNF